MIARRMLLSTAALAGPILFTASCGINAATTLAMAQSYGGLIADALSAAAQAYLAGPPPPSASAAKIVTTAVADLQTAKAALEAATARTDAVSVARELVTAAQRVSPIVAPFLGPAAPYLLLGLGVLQAFVDSLPPPPATPTEPPAGLRMVARSYHHH